jgi:hypothetical protein
MAMQCNLFSILDIGHVYLITLGMYIIETDFAIRCKSMADCAQHSKIRLNYIYTKPGRYAGEGAPRPHTKPTVILNWIVQPVNNLFPFQLQL